MVCICDDRSCADRPKSQVSADTVDRIQNPEADARIEKLKRLAEGNPGAPYDLGQRYFRGDGIRQDSYQALLWMRKAAESGDLQAQKALGSFYLFGLEEMGSDPPRGREVADDRSRPCGGTVSTGTQNFGVSSATSVGADESLQRCSEPLGTIAAGYYLEPQIVISNSAIGGVGGVIGGLIRGAFGGAATAWEWPASEHIVRGKEQAWSAPQGRCDVLMATPASAPAQRPFICAAGHA